MKPQPPERTPALRLTQVEPIPVQPHEGAPVTATMLVEVVAPSYPPYDFLWQAEHATVAPVEHEPRVTITATPPIAPGAPATDRATLTTARVTVIDIFGQTVQASAPVQYQRSAARPPSRPRPQPAAARSRSRWPLVTLLVILLLALAGGGALLYGRHLLGGAAHPTATATTAPGQLEIAPLNIAAHPCYDRGGDPVQLTLGNTGGQDLTFTATYTPGVVNSNSQRTITPTSGDIPAGGTTTLTVSGFDPGSSTSQNSIDFTWTSAGVSHETQVFESCQQPPVIP